MRRDFWGNTNRTPSIQLTGESTNETTILLPVSSSLTRRPSSLPPVSSILELATCLSRKPSSVIACVTSSAVILKTTPTVAQKPSIGKLLEFEFYMDLRGGNWRSCSREYMRHEGVDSGGQAYTSALSSSFEAFRGLPRTAQAEIAVDH